MTPSEPASDDAERLRKGIDKARRSNAEFYWYEASAIDKLIRHKDTKKAWKNKKPYWPLPESKKAAIREILEASQGESE